MLYCSLVHLDKSCLVYNYSHLQTPITRACKSTIIRAYSIPNAPLQTEFRLGSRSFYRRSAVVNDLRKFLCGEGFNFGLGTNWVAKELL